jgi:hypothetical protein
MIFRRNPVDALAKQRTLLAGDEQKIAELQRERAAALVETEGVAEIEELDQRIAALRRACSIHHDRISALEMQVRAEAHEKLEQRRLTAVKTIEKKLAARTAVAAELEASIKKTGNLFFALLNSPGIGADWPFGHVPGAAVDVDAVRREVGWAAFSAGRPSGGRTIYPPPQNKVEFTPLALLPWLRTNQTRSCPCCGKCLLVRTKRPMRVRPLRACRVHTAWPDWPLPEVNPRRPNDAPHDRRRDDEGRHKS